MWRGNFARLQRKRLEKLFAFRFSSANFSDIFYEFLLFASRWGRGSLCVFSRNTFKSDWNLISIWILCRKIIFLLTEIELKGNKMGMKTTFMLRRAEKCVENSKINFHSLVRFVWFVIWRDLLTVFRTKKSFKLQFLLLETE